MATSRFRERKILGVLLVLTPIIIAYASEVRTKVTAPASHLGKRYTPQGNKLPYHNTTMRLFTGISILAMADSAKRLGCLSCFVEFPWHSDKKCYDGDSGVPWKRCERDDECYTELNPLFIRRDCKSPSRLNRTFVCKCPLCNDKPSNDTSFYEYETTDDWEYDNHRLKTTVIDELLCKVCDTNGVNEASDDTCRNGRNVDFMACEDQQLCFINMNNEQNYVSRGCINKPAHNSMYFFCKQDGCNRETLPQIAKQKVVIRRAMTASRFFNHAQRYAEWNQWFHVCLFILILMYM